MRDDVILLLSEKGDSIKVYFKNKEGTYQRLGVSTSDPSPPFGNTDIFKYYSKSSNYYSKSFCELIDSLVSVSGQDQCLQALKKLKTVRDTFNASAEGKQGISVYGVKNVNVAMTDIFDSFTYLHENTINATEHNINKPSVSIHGVTDLPSAPCNAHSDVLEGLILFVGDWFSKYKDIYQQQNLEQKGVEYSKMGWAHLGWIPAWVAYRKDPNFIQGKQKGEEEKAKETKSKKEKTDSLTM
ncbi:MAG: hypothetical protein ACHQJ6_08345 [Candidatus Berkiellales bacterium]